MKVIINENENNKEIEIIINCKNIDDTVLKLINKLKEEAMLLQELKMGVYML